MSHQKARADILLIMENGNSKSLGEHPNFSGGEKCLKLGGLFNMGTNPFKTIIGNGNLVPLFDGNEFLGVFYPRKHIEFFVDDAAQTLRGMSVEERKAIPTHCENPLFIVRRRMILGKKRRLKQVKTKEFILKKITVQKKTEAEEVVPYISAKICVSNFKTGRIRKETFKRIIEKNQLVAFYVGKQVVAYFCPKKLFESHPLGIVSVPASGTQPKPRGSVFARPCKRTGFFLQSFVRVPVGCYRHSNFAGN